MIRLKVKEIAQAKGISQGLLGRNANVDVKTMRKIYQHPTSSITLEILDRLAKALKVDASELIESIPDDTSTT